MANITLTANETRFVNSMNNAAGAAGRLAATVNVQLARSFREADAITRQFSAGIGRMGESVQQVGRSLSTYVTFPILALGGAALKVYADMDQLKRGLDAYNISLNEIKKTAKLPGLGLEEAAKSTITFASVKYNAELSTKAVREFGNALVYSGRGKEELAGIATAFAQMKGKGNVMAQEINQIAERLPMIRDLMQQAFGASDTEVLQKRGIKADQFLEGVVKQLEKLPRVSGGLKVAWENIIDSLKIGGYEIASTAEKLFNFTAIVDKVSGVIDSLIDSFKSLSPETQKMIFIITGVTAAIGPMVVAVGLAIKAYGMLFTGTGMLALKLTGLLGILMSVGFVYLDHLETTKKIADATHSLADVEEQARRSIHEQAKAVQDQAFILENSNSTLADRKKAIKALNDISPEYFSNLSAEKTNYSDLNAAVSKYINSLESAAKAKMIDLQLQVSYKAEQDILSKPGASMSALEQAIAKGGDWWRSFQEFYTGGVYKNETSFLDEVALKDAQAIIRIRDNIKELEAQMKKLIAAGYAPPKPAGATNVGNIVSSVEQSEKELKKQRDILENVHLKNIKMSGAESLYKITMSSEKGTRPFDDIIAAAENLKNKLPKVLSGINLDNAAKSLEQQIQQNLSLKVKLAILELNNTVTEMFKQLQITLISNAATGIGEAIGQALGGGGMSFARVFQSIISTIGDYMQELGKKMLAAGQLIEIAKKLFGTQPGIGAAIALIAGGGLLKGLAGTLFNATPKFANGGLVYGPTLGLMGEYSGARSNPEVIAPLSKLREMIGGDGGTIQLGEIRLEGEALVLAINRYRKRNGSNPL